MYFDFDVLFDTEFDVFVYLDSKKVKLFPGLLVAVFE